jgi:3-hydroxyacyl-CoA dehydrogenase
MLKSFRTVAVLGAGIMGAQIAAHLANAGLTVQLLDLSAPSGPPNDLVETAFKKALKLSPPILFTESTARRVILGNFDQHFQRVADVDWVIEAVVENLPIKQALMARLAGVVRPDAVISTNTSGLSIQAMVQDCPEDFRQRFLGTHFFNPPRYLKLVEIIPTAETDRAVIQRMEAFMTGYLGKGVVMAKDTPNFIANRIGVYVTMLGLRALTQQDYTIAEIDTLTGPLIGRPKSATFRTADLVGLDTLMSVLTHLYPAIPQDEARDVFQIPEVLSKLVATGTLGAKTGQGFYKKQAGQILSLNPVTFAYESAPPLNLEGLAEIASLPHLRDRLQALYQASGRAGDFFRSSMLALFSYSACRIPEIADNPIDLDRAMRWGFGWDLGPFELWDEIGFSSVLADLKAAGLAIPAWVETMQQQRATGFYQGDRPSLVSAQSPAHDLDLEALKADPQRTLWHNAEAALLDLGDGVALYEFRSKGNTLSLKVLEGLAEALTRLETSDLIGLVIGNGSAHFSGGANLAEMGMMAQTGNFAALDELIVTFQALLQRLHYAAKPIVAAVQGRALGGGCELVMACPHVVAAAETYIGLVEVSVGLIPGAGGITRMVTQAIDRAATEAPSHIQPFLRAVFETIATAKVSTSAYEAQTLGFLPPTTQIILNGDRRLTVAKATVLHLHQAGYRPPPERNALMVLGRPTRAMLEHAAYIFQQSGWASEYDRHLANELAYVMTGGDLSAPALVPESYLLQLERERFIPLLHQPQTQARIAHMLKTKKPLRN